MIRAHNNMLTTVSVALLSATRIAAQQPACNGTSGPDFANCCFSAWQSYRSEKDAYESPTPTYVDWLYSTVYEVNTSVPTTTLCDGFVRYMEPLETTIYETKITPSPTTYNTVWITQTYTKPEPTCTINESDCVPFASSYSSASSAWATNNSLPSPTEYIPCTTYLACPTQEPADGGQVCKLYGGDVTVYYWPITTTGNFCAATRTTVTGPQTPKSTVISGTTMVSPTVYVNIASASAARHNGQYTHTPCGYGRSNILLSFADATMLSTRPYKPGTATNTKPVNLADWATPVPASNYFFGRPTVCTTSACPTLELEVTPTLDVPRVLMSADPEWKYCTPRSEGFFGTETYIPLETNPPRWP